MRKCSWYSLMVILTASICNSCVAPSIHLQQTTLLTQYPSASALSWANQTLYITGDDAKKVLLTDQHHKEKDSILLAKNQLARISKEEKPDYESSFLSTIDGAPYLHVVGSLSTKNRYKLGWINLQTNQLERTDSIVLPPTVAASINIEGSTLINKKMVLANRANQSHRVNQLFVLEWENKADFSGSNLVTIQVQLRPSSAVIGISDLHYFAPKDWLLFTASTENTADAYSDGAIGDSYIGLIKNVSKKLQQSALRPDSFQNLTDILGRKKAYKIEGITVQSERAGKLILHLAADNDNGESTLFKLLWIP